MTSAVAVRIAPAARPLALACAVSLSLIASGACAQEQAMPSVLITGARFASDPALAPIGATVITAADIRRAGATDVNQAIRKIGGVYGRQSLDSSPDFALDLRGFGANGPQNMVVLVNGVRLSENEQANAVLASIPVDSVERIEITRGGSSVLFGDGATGGVIQIFTRRGAATGTHGSLFGEAGQFDQHDLRASLARGQGPLSLDAAVDSQGTDNYRANSRFRQDSFSGGAQWKTDGGRLGVRVERARQDSRFPGSLTLEQFEADPRQASTPGDFGSLDSSRVTAFAEQRIGGTEFAAELSRREKNVDASYAWSYGGASGVSRMAYDSRQTQFSPRLRRLAHFDGMVNELVAGVDLVRWERKTTSSFSLADGRQDSKAVYARDEIRWDAAHDGRIAFGARRELFDKDYADPLAVNPAPEHSVQGVNAWEAQGSYRMLPLVDLHLRAGQSYRVPNIDENSFRSSPGVLKVQTSHDLELGATFGDDEHQLAARAFRHSLRNEIFFDPTLPWGGANTNLDPTRRQGFELDALAALAPGWRASAHLQHVNATFTEGPNAGREMVLVPKNLVSARLSWSGEGQSADVGAQWAGSQRYGSDFTNGCDGRIPSYATLDARYARQLGPWELALSGLNLADRQYFSNAFACKGGIYPSDGRQLKVSARYDF